MTRTKQRSKQYKNINPWDSSRNVNPFNNQNVDRHPPVALAPRAAAPATSTFQQSSNISRTPEQIAFDLEFSKWEKSFEDWKRAYANHPDRESYFQYEKKFLDVREKLLTKRMQIYAPKLNLISQLDDQLNAASMMAESILQKFSDSPSPSYNNQSMMTPLNNSYSSINSGSNQSVHRSRSPPSRFNNRDDCVSSFSGSNDNMGSKQNFRNSQGNSCSPLGPYSNQTPKMEFNRNNMNIESMIADKSIMQNFNDSPTPSNNNQSVSNHEDNCSDYRPRSRQSRFDYRDDYVSLNGSSNDNMRSNQNFRNSRSPRNQTPITEFNRNDMNTESMIADKSIMQNFNDSPAPRNNNQSMMTSMSGNYEDNYSDYRSRSRPSRFNYSDDYVSLSGSNENMRSNQNFRNSRSPRNQTPITEFNRNDMNTESMIADKSIMQNFNDSPAPSNNNQSMMTSMSDNYEDNCSDYQPRSRPSRFNDRDDYVSLNGSNDNMRSNQNFRNRRSRRKQTPRMQHNRNDMNRSQQGQNSNKNHSENSGSREKSPPVNTILRVIDKELKRKDPVIKSKWVLTTDVKKPAGKPGPLGKLKKVKKKKLIKTKKLLQISNQDVEIILDGVKLICPRRMSGAMRRRFFSLKGMPVDELTKDQKAFMDEMESIRVGREKFFKALSKPVAEVEMDSIEKVAETTEEDATKASTEVELATEPSQNNEETVSKVAEDAEEKRLPEVVDASQTVND